MPVRKFNYTARQRLKRADVDITLRRGLDSVAIVDARLDLASYRLPPDAQVAIEAYRQTTLMRFPWGTVSVPQPPADRRLSAFVPDVRILFRVKVTDVSERRGVLLAVADQIRPRDADEQPDLRIPLLPPEPDNLGDEVWRIDFEGEPALLVNRDLADWKAAVRSDTFRALVYPQALRSILTRILVQEGFTGTDDFEDWRSRWLMFATRVLGAGAVPAVREQHEEWIENAVSTFARKFRMLDLYESGEKTI